jgi:hypothetical protein
MFISRKSIVQPRASCSLYHRAVGYNYEAVKIFMPPSGNDAVSLIGIALEQAAADCGRRPLGTWNALGH